MRRARPGELQTLEIVDPELSLTGTAIAFDAAGGLVVSGRREQGLVFEGFVQRYDGANTLTWERRGPELGTGIVSIDAIAPTEGGIVLAGAVPGSLWVGRVDDAGALEWSADDSGAPGDGHAAADIAVLPDGDLVVVGWQGDTGSYGIPWLMRFTGDGIPLWSETLPADDDGAYGLDAVAVTDEGRIFVAGLTSSSGVGRARHVDEIDCDGNSVWRWTHENPEPPDWGTGGGLAWSPTLGVVVSGGDYVTDVDHRAFVARLAT